MQSSGRPVIPKGEYPRRWRATQKLMENKGYDLVLTYSDDRATAGAAHARYMAGFQPHFEPVSIALLPEGDPHMLTGPESEEYARLVGQLEQIHVLREFTHPDEDYPYAVIRGLREILDGFTDVGGIRRVGVGGLDAMGEKTLTALRRALPDATWVDAEADLSLLRAVKTSAEIAVIRRAYGVAEKGMEAAISSVKPGVTERAVAAEAEYAMRRAGSEGMGIDTIVASGPNSRPILARTTLRKIERDDLVLVTLAPRYEGYHGAIARPVLVGEPGEEIKKAAEAAYDAQSTCHKALRPGIQGRLVEAEGRRVMTEAGLGENFLYSGLHSVGVVEFEPPIFGPGSREVLRENMVISVDIPVFNAPWGGLRVEDGYLITRDGCEKLNK
ncbi:MAG: Xaa-Pro peptidase family protein [Candidatus Bathyarchaeota archaeon]|nr:Xaa-Pro peptidase family protein [Candidatus Bathyarchaeota archaeon]